MGSPASILNRVCIDDLRRVTQENNGQNPFIFPPANSEFIDAFRSVVVAAASELEIFSIDLDRNEWARFNRLGIEPDTNGSVTMADAEFRIEVNRTPFRLYAKIEDQIATGDLPQEIFMKVYEAGAQIRVIGVNNDALSPATMFARLTGWTVPF